MGLCTSTYAGDHALDLPQAGRWGRFYKLALERARSAHLWKEPLPAKSSPGLPDANAAASPVVNPASSPRQGLASPPAWRAGAAGGA